MSASYFDLLKYAATGIASPDMTYYDRMRASTLMGGVVKTLTGQPPLTFKADGTPLISWSMKGNGSQSGTPTPDNPVMPDFVGVRTENRVNADDWYLPYKNGDVYTATGNTFIGVNIKPFTAGDIGKTFTFSAKFKDIHVTNARVYAVTGGTASNGNNVNTDGGQSTITVTVASVDDYLRVSFGGGGSQTMSVYEITLVEGSTAPSSYIPYGYKIQISCAGQTVPVYLGQTQTVRRIGKLILTGDESWIIWNGNYFSSVIDNLTINNSRLFCTHFIDDGTNGIRIVSGTAKLKVASAAVSDFAQDLTAFKQFLSDEYTSGHPVTIWYVLATPETAIVNEPLCKIGTYADELHSTDAAVTIPTAKGQNTLTVDTPIQPSEMTITYKG